MLKKHISKLMLVPLLLLLSGCGEDIGYSYQSFDISDMGSYFSAHFRDMGLDFANNMNNIFYMIRAGALNTIELTIGQVGGALNSISVLPAIISATAIVGIAIIIVRFAWIVFKNYFLSLGEHEAPITMVLIKKLVLSVIFVAVAPYIIINGFLISSILGTQVVSFMSGYSDGSTVQTNDYVDVNRDLNIAGINFITYCWQSKDDADYDLPDWSVGLIPKQYDKLLSTYLTPDVKTLFQMQMKMTLGEKIFYNQSRHYDFRILYPAGQKDFNTGPHMTSLYNTYCTPYSILGTTIYPASVYQSMMENPALQDDVTLRVGGVSTVVSRNRLLFQGGVVVDAFLSSFLSILLMGAFAIVAFIATAIRIGELLITILATPFFAMNYLTTERSNAMATFVQEISSIFLTHIVTVIVFALGVFEMGKTWTFHTPFLAGAMIWVVMKGPQIIRNWTSSTGAGGIAGGAARGALGALKNL